jgi:hypothetical protein
MAEKNLRLMGVTALSPYRAPMQPAQGEVGCRVQGFARIIDRL